MNRALKTTNIIRAVVYIRRLHRKCVFNAGGFRSSSAPRRLEIDTSRRSFSNYYYMGATSKFNKYGTTVVLSTGVREKACMSSREAVGRAAACYLPDSSITFPRFVHSRCGALKRDGVGFCGVDSVYGTLCITMCELLTGSDFRSVRRGEHTVILTGESTSLSTSVIRRRVLGRRLPRKTSPTTFICALTGITTKRVYVHRGVRKSGAFFVRGRSSNITRECTHSLVTGGGTSTIVYN